MKGNCLQGGGLECSAVKKVEFQLFLKGSPREGVVGRRFQDELFGSGVLLMNS